MLSLIKKPRLISALARVASKIDEEKLLLILEKLAEFADNHDVFVPSLTVSVGPAQVELSAKRIPSEK